jgi:membrane protease YdiL (CAAX protease family)
MNTPLTTKQDKLWVYVVLPILVLLLGGMLTYSIYFAFAAVRPELVSGLPAGQITFGLYILIAAVEWALAISIVCRLRRAGASAMDLVAPQGDPWAFRGIPALLLFLAFNGLLVVFMIFLKALAGTQDYYDGLHLWQRLLFVTMIPITAGFCEEFIWRGYVITRLEARGRGRWATILLAALFFALIHSPLHWFFTFLLGIVAGYYYVRERNLIPLMISHAIADLWTFGWWFFSS